VVVTAFYLLSLIAFAADGGAAPEAGGVPPGALDAAVVDAADAGVPPDAPPEAPLPIPPPPPPPPPRLEAPGVRAPLRARVLGRGTREPLAGASVTIDATPVGEADDQGRVDLMVNEGRRRLQIQHPGYDPLEVEVDVSASAGREQVFRLSPRQSGERYETVVVPNDERAARTTLREEELTRVPGSFGDPFRVIESLPGVSQVVWPLALYAIRGANPGNTGFFLDGVRVPGLFHFALGPSVIHPFFLEQIDFYPGGYPLKYGRYVSGIVAARTASPPVDRTHVSADLRLFDAGGIVASPINNGRGTVAAAFRYSYTGVVLSRISPDVEFGYWDYQVRGEHRVGSGRLVLFAFGSGDVLGIEGQTAGNIGAAVSSPGGPAQPQTGRLWFHRVDLRWDGKIGGGRGEVSVLAGRDSSETSLTQIVARPIGVATSSLAPRLGWTRPLTTWMDLELGGDAEAQRFRPWSEIPGAAEALDVFRNRDALSAGAYAGLTLRPGTRLSISPGLRYEMFLEEGARRFEPSPRLNLRVRPGGDVWLKASVGRFAQMASLPVAIPGFEGFGLTTYGTQLSIQGSVGVEAPLGDVATIDVTGFYQRLRLTDLESVFNYDLNRKNLLELRDGESYGVELMLRRALTKRLHGWLAYTLSKSVRLVGFYRLKADSDWDQRHILNLVMGYRLPRGYAVGTRIHFNTGRPYPVYDPRSFRVNYDRLPSFFQFDVRGDKRFYFDKFVLDAYVELVNSTLSREVYDLRKGAGGALEEKGFRIVLPSIGLHAEW
jgi:hypothetical protein